MAAFLKGTGQYRPGSRVDAALFSQLFINPDTFLYEREKEMKIQ
ncbi:hypothetical protein [uncultured Chitinophaga sp.]|nr:hypothetical protein [uncultured Chitinophaga sp.]